MSGFTGALGPFGPLLYPVVAAMLGGIAKSVVTRVKPDSQGIMLRFGKVLRDKDGNPKIYGPGLKARVPVIFTLMQRRVLETNLEFEQQQFYLGDGSVFIATPMLRYRVTNVAKALIDINDLESAVKQESLDILRRMLTKYTRETLGSLDDQLSVVQQDINAVVEKWGAEILRVGLPGMAPEKETREAMAIEQKTDARLKACKAAEAQGFSKELQVALSGDNPFLLGVEPAAVSSVVATKDLVRSNGHAPVSVIPVIATGA